MIITGGFNAKVREREENVIRLGIRKVRGEKVVELCHANNLIIGNMVSATKKKEMDNESSRDKSRNQIDYILVGKRSRNVLLSAKTHHVADGWIVCQ